MVKVTSNISHGPIAFYSTSPKDRFRFGDIVRGILWTEVLHRKPKSDSEDELEIEVVRPKYAAILTPCCSIENGEFISIAPLRRLSKEILKTQLIIDDPTRINRMMLATDTMPKKAWDEMDMAKKQERFGQDYNTLSYHFYEHFVYAEHDSLTIYDPHIEGLGHPISYYSISFKEISTVNCTKIGVTPSSGMMQKILELTKTARKDLRYKIGYYYSRSAPEDEEH